MDEDNIGVSVCVRLPNFLYSLIYPPAGILLICRVCKLYAGMTVNNKLFLHKAAGRSAWLCFGLASCCVSYLAYYCLASIIAWLLLLVAS
jgi:hypothetical protein